MSESPGNGIQGQKRVLRRTSRFHDERAQLIDQANQVLRCAAGDVDRHEDHRGELLRELADQFDLAMQRLHA